MKKRLLITSIVMMLVVAVALSTATYAWFTSNATVTANTISMKAAVNDAPSLGISWIDANYLTAIDAVAPVIDNDEEDPDNTQYFFPAAPLSLVDVAQKEANDNLTLTTAANIAFYTALATPNLSGNMVFAGNGATTPVYTWHDSSNHDSFFVKNLSPANAMNTVTMNVTVTGSGVAPDLLRIAVFKKNTSSQAFELLTVLGKAPSTVYEVVAQNTAMDGDTVYYKKYLGKYVVAVKGEDSTVEAADWYPGMQAPADKFYTVSEATPHAVATYGEIVGTQPVNNMSEYTCSNDLSVVVAEDLEALGKIELMVMVWEDCVALGDVEQGLVSTIGFTFTAA